MTIVSLLFMAASMILSEQYDGQTGLFILIGNSDLLDNPYKMSATAGLTWSFNGENHVIHVSLFTEHPTVFE